MFTSKNLNALPAIGGNLSVWVENTRTGEVVSVNENAPHIAASVIKLAVMLAAFEKFESGGLDPDGLYTLSPADKVPSCGALTYMHDGLKVTYLDIVTLMIILSDNTATNIMINTLGIEYINSVCARYGLNDLCLRRRMFDSEAAAKGLQNTITAKAVACFYRKLLAKEPVSLKASEKMLSILLDQRLNGKLPFYLHGEGIKVAHKTGEDDGVSHDTGIIFGDEPYIAVFLGNDTDVPAFERYIQDSAAAICCL